VLRTDRPPAVYATASVTDFSTYSDTSVHSDVAFLHDSMNQKILKLVYFRPRCWKTNKKSATVIRTQWYNGCYRGDLVVDDEGGILVEDWVLSAGEWCEVLQHVLWMNIRRS